MVKQLLKKEYEQEQWWKDTVAWIKNIPNELDSKKPVPKKAWRVFEANTVTAARDAAGDAAWDAGRDAAGDAAWDAAWDAAGDAAWDAAWDAGRDAAWDAVRDAAWNAARDAGRDAAGDAAWDATLFSLIKICAGLDIDKKHITHAEERWEANKRGFSVFCDVDGVLYVYRKKERRG